MSAGTNFNDGELSEREASAVASCALLLGRLQALIEEETAALAAPGALFLGQFTERKNQLLRDLLGAQRACTTARTIQALAPRSRTLRAHLEPNLRALKAHMDAVGQVSAIIVDSIRRAESDGTYSR